MERSALGGLTERDIKKIIEENEGGTKYQRLEGYYVGDHDILRYTKKDKAVPNNRLVNNMPRYITDTAVGYFLGKPVTYSSQDDAFLQALQDIFDYNDEQDENTELAKTASIDGSCFEMLYMDEDAMIRFVKVAPGSCVMIYETGYSTPMAALRFIHSKDRDGNPIKKVEFWTSTECWYFISLHGGPLELTDIVEHYWQDVPFIEYINNEERIGDFEGVITLVDAYNRVQSNTANFFQYNDEAILKVLKMGEVTPQNIKDMKEAGAILLEDGGDIQWLIKEVADTPLENYKQRLREDMHLFSNVPNLNDENFGGNLSGVAVSYKLWGLEQVCAIKERKFKRALQRRIELITTMLNIQGGHYDYRDIDLQFRRNRPQNLLESAQIVTTLSGELSRESRLQMLPTVDNVQDELQKLEEEKKADMGDFGGYNALANALQQAQAPEQPQQPPPVPAAGRG
ncbi:phage portal protein [bacterium D16-76]|nr:phage portal protein [bacterium D16-76]